MKNCHILFILLVLSLVACKSDREDFIPDPTLTMPTNFVTTSVGGQILDENNMPLAEVALKIHARNGIINVTTDENGIFLTKNIEVRQDRLYIETNTEGYFLGSKTITVQANAIENVQIKLLEKGFNGEFNSDVGGEILTTDGAKVTFSPNSIADAEGNVYNGMVMVAARWLNPSSADIFQIMPGNLIGEDAEGIEYALGTAGMLAVELFSTDNEELNLLSGATAELTFPIPLALSNIAPTEIPLWSFDENKGIWVLEGTAQRSANQYIATVTHFSFWNCDALFPVINGEGKVVDTNGNPVANALVKINIQGGLETRSGWTNSEGMFSGQLPKDELLELNVCDACNDPIIGPITVGPFSNDAVLNDLILSPNNNGTTIFGTVVDCDDNPVADGYVVVTGSNIAQYAFLETDGSFNNTFLTCADSIGLIAVDLVNVKSSPAQGFGIQSIIDADTIQACDDLAEFIIFDLDGNAVEYTDPIDNTGSYNGEGINLLNAAEGFSLFAETFDPQLNTPFPVTFMMINSLGNLLNYQVDLTLTSFGNPGELMEGIISGSFDEDNGTTHSIDGSFKVIRDF